jgi:ribosomal protein S18 acetylase RimI-like enzyme
MSDETSRMASGPEYEQISFRSATGNDSDFLYALHVASMKEYVHKTWGWDDAFQESVFRKNYDPAEIKIIRYAQKEIGMLSLEEREADIFLRTIEIHPDYQGKGIGTVIINGIIADGTQKMKAVYLRVLKVNPAKRLYDRLGFSVIEETPTHYIMRTSKSE